VKRQFVCQQRAMRPSNCSRGGRPRPGGRAWNAATATGGRPIALGLPAPLDMPAHPLTTTRQPTVAASERLLRDGAQPRSLRELAPASPARQLAGSREPWYCDRARCVPLGRPGCSPAATLMATYPNYGQPDPTSFRPQPGSGSFFGFTAPPWSGCRPSRSNQQRGENQQ